MKKIIKFVLLIVITIVFACRNSSKTKGNIVKKSNMVSGLQGINVSNKADFLDSTIADSDLSVEQIKRHTIADKSFFSTYKVFTGDTVYYIHAKHPIAIIKCDDRLVCLNYYMFIFNRADLKNTDYKKVKTGCDEEQDVSSCSLDYAVVNDSLFYIKNIYTERAEGKDDKVNVVKHYFKINRYGKIVHQANIN